MQNESWNGDPPNIDARLLVLCREVRWNVAEPHAPYTLSGLLAVFRPPGEFPLRWSEPVHLYAEFFGDAGEYEVWFDLVRFVTDEDGEIVGEVEDACYGPFALTLYPGKFVQGRAYVLKVFPFLAAGLHETRLRVAGVPHALIAQRYIVEESL